ncbi:mammalian cell entry related domain protein [Mizugakiibacter sediminis]|uniref:Mammalian cell entry related domain protein n=1 Tax=Mizugakiibacter sediminis TaxID=1475481 RepID=A0A0K8QML6_9GAMM|nr:MlaD family protein [Mizugakiibacter sediminis]GAP65657.1 mammalian cell entry related domain protein [Mizugakiibacter sediminis]
METRAHHVLIGAFTLLVVFAALLFTLWLGKTRAAREYAYYDIVFSEAVTGLSRGGLVQYNGIKVGEVAMLKLDPADPRKVLARIQVAADTPVKQDTRAKLGLLGLTGVAFIQLTGGSPGSPPLLPSPSHPVPVIEADNSALARLLSSSEDIVTTVNDILNRVRDMLSEDNLERIDHTLDHLDQATAAVADEREDIRTLVQQLAQASRQINTALARVDALAQSSQQLLDGDGKATLQSARAAMASLDRASANLEALFEQNRGALQSGVQGLAQLGPAIAELRESLQSLRRVTTRLEDNPAGFLLGRDHSKEFEPK